VRIVRHWEHWVFSIRLIWSLLFTTCCNCKDLYIKDGKVIRLSYVFVMNHVYLWCDGMFHVINIWEFLPILCLLTMSWRCVCIILILSPILVILCVFILHPCYNILLSLWSSMHLTWDHPLTWLRIDLWEDFFFQLYMNIGSKLNSVKNDYEWMQGQKMILWKMQI
jgi:hypothetical protein